MKIRKHKNNIRFLITFQVRTWTAAGKERLSAMQSETAVGRDWSSVWRAFLFGRDRTNVFLRKIVTGRHV